MLRDKINEVLNTLIQVVPTKEMIQSAHIQLENIFRDNNLTIYFWLKSDEEKKTIVLDPIDEMSRYALIGILNDKVY